MVNCFIDIVGAVMKFLLGNLLTGVMNIPLSKS